VISKEDRDLLEKIKKDMEPVMELADKLLEKDPTLGITAMIIAKDTLSKKLADEQLANGTPFITSCWFVGSYARLEWVYEQIEKGTVTKEEVFKHLPSLWRGSDPDDSDHRFWGLWKEAWESNGKKYIFDDKPLPRKRSFIVYRGQDDNGSIGISWTLDKNIAEKFAHGAALRQSNRAGIIYQACAMKKDIWAYLTERGEEEIIINPFYLKDYEA